MAIEISSNELTILHTSVERVAASLTATIAHFQRAGAKELADLHQLAIEDIVRLREIVGKAMKQPAPAPLVLPPDHLENMARFIEGAEQGA